MPKRPRLEQIREMRRLWSPKLPEMPEQCTSCPFREGNDKEFKEILVRLAASGGLDPRGISVDNSRFSIQSDADTQGDFLCHQSAYNPDMTMRDREFYRQCPGASAHFRNGEKAVPPRFKKMMQAVKNPPPVIANMIDAIEKDDE